MSQPPDCEAKGSCQAGCKEVGRGQASFCYYAVDLMPCFNKNYSNEFIYKNGKDSMSSSWCAQASQGLGWHLGHGASQAELTDAGVSYEEAVVIVDTINSGIELVRNYLPFAV